MVCYKCGGNTEVFNSRTQKRSNQVWRRRRCKKCAQTFTTHESVLLPALFRVKGSSSDEPFIPEQLLVEILATLHDSPGSYEAAAELCSTITRNVLKNASNGLILASSISLETSQVLKRYNKQAWLRYYAEHPSLQR